MWGKISPALSEMLSAYMWNPWGHMYNAFSGTVAVHCSLQQVECLCLQTANSIVHKIWAVGFGGFDSSSKFKCTKKNRKTIRVKLTINWIFTVKSISWSSFGDAGFRYNWVKQQQNTNRQKNNNRAWPCRGSKSHLKDLRHKTGFSLNIHLVKCMNRSLSGSLANLENRY